MQASLLFAALGVPFRWDFYVNPAQWDADRTMMAILGSTPGSREKKRKKKTSSVGHTLYDPGCVGPHLGLTSCRHLCRVGMWQAQDQDWFIPLSSQAFRSVLPAFQEAAARLKRGRQSGSSCVTPESRWPHGRTLRDERRGVTLNQLTRKKKIQYHSAAHTPHCMFEPSDANECHHGVGSSKESCRKSLTPTRPRGQGAISLIPSAAKGGPRHLKLLARQPVRGNSEGKHWPVQWGFSKIHRDLQPYREI
ncbi:hypothetical protein B0J13DRAFT_602889 [Dactylonectria estremocensis]|uniref:Uncharacterized protein n=1 Tax=Dactylonectria estremocensis TaxID=1079267 RepID=A0A9P9FCH7_9HYPO|nr:hypothetical protein B0J13DRAFT_602889 [Dactylonectria estremocensis]